MRVGTTELIVILLVVLIIFGPTQIPRLMKMLGRGVKSLREGMEDKGDKENAEEANKDKSDSVNA